MQISMGGSKERNFLSIKLWIWAYSFSQSKIKLSFLLGGLELSGASARGMYLVLALHAPGFLEEDRRPGSKKSAMLRISEASSATTIHYGLCLSLVLSGKPRLGTAMGWNLGTGGSGKGRGAAKEKLRHELVSKGLGRGLWVKCTTSREC
jgi:hypothetical protein